MKARIFVRHADIKNGECTNCKERILVGKNYCYRCGHRFIGIIKHLQIQFKFHILPRRESWR